MAIGCVTDNGPMVPGEPSLIGGRPADPKDWPASVYISSGGGRCTATVIGPHVLITAAHCVSNGGTATFAVLANRYSAKCTHSKAYSGNSTADYALCKIDKMVEGIPYESVLLDPNVLKVGSEIMLTGYGCVRRGGGGGNDGIYRIGEAKVTKLPSGSNNDIVTDRQSVALCFGDSGGPAFYYLDKTKRVVISINSRGNIADTSYLSALFTTEGVRFMNAWQQGNDMVGICGLSTGVVGCRNAGGGDLPEPKPGCSAQAQKAKTTKDSFDSAFKELADCATIK
jgi:secreted trypsin-like serine protease